MHETSSNGAAPTAPAMSRKQRLVGPVPMPLSIYLLMFGAGAVFIVAGIITAVINAKPPNEQQLQFAAIMVAYRDSYNAADDLAKPAYRPQRANTICNLFNGNLSVADWHGFVKERWHTSDGRAGLAVWLLETRLSVTLLSDEETLISPSDPLNKKILTLTGNKIYNFGMGRRVGEFVSFSGQFMPSTMDCVREVSMTASGSMTEPQCSFKFSSLRSFGIPGAGQNAR
jgi:hypothetical protein